MSTQDTARTAVLVFHGMGQQVPFQTLGEVAQKVAAAVVDEAPDLGKPSLAVETVPLKSGSEPPEVTVPRVRMTLDSHENAQRVDFYECYWAPITEGKVGLIDVLAFLRSSGWAGIRFCLQGSFTRWFWKGKTAYPIRKDGAFLLALALVLIGSGLTLALALALVLGAQAAAFFAASPPAWLAGVQAALVFLARLLLVLAPAGAAGLILLNHGRWPAAKVAVAAVAGLALSLLLLGPGSLTPEQGRALVLVFASPWLLAGLWQALYRLDPPEKRPSFAVHLLVAAGIALGTALLAVSILVLLALWRGAPTGEGSGGWAALHGFFTRSEPGRVLLLVYAIGGGTLFWKLRKFLIQYVGDVAAYVSSHRVSKFNEIRGRILDEAFKVARHVFETKEYEKVVLIGHSLGSVVAYDILNGCINADLALGKKWNAAARTSLLLTFGSPLNKIAFIFRSQVRDNDLREYLAAAKQPLLEEGHAYRPVRWVNLWSPQDIISGNLNLFDVGSVEPVSAGPEGYRFRYRPFAEGEALPPLSPRVKQPSPSPRGGDPTPAKEPSPVLPLIDPDADIPLAAHNQFWNNGLLYRIVLQALRDEGNGKWLREYFKVEKAEAEGGDAVPGIGKEKPARRRRAALSSQP